MPRWRWVATSSSVTMERRSSSFSISILLTSWLVRKPSKKCRKGTRLRSVEDWEISAKSWACWTLSELSMAKPVWRQAITSAWSPKIDRAWVAIVRAVTCRTKGVSSPAIRYMLGMKSSRPWEAVKDVAREPAWRAPCTAPAAPPSDCISMTEGIVPQMFLRPWADHSSDHSPMLDEGVMG